ncbi:MAG: ATP-dependent DNA helicase RecG, partial [Clostridia bacterium]|nr:ATP-dependent DNA helicase RecG [Clostridia bacterium]
AYCFLMTDGKDEVNDRLSVMCKTDDGFKIAEEDLRLRGPGDFLGDRQHGAPEFTIADLATDMRVLSCARDDAAALLKKDPELTSHPALLRKVRTLISEKEATLN